MITATSRMSSTVNHDTLDHGANSCVTESPGRQIANVRTLHSNAADRGWMTIRRILQICGTRVQFQRSGAGRRFYMPSFGASLRKLNVSCALMVVALFLPGVSGLLAEATGCPQADALLSPAQETKVQEPQSQRPQPQEPQSQEPQAPASKYDKAIFQKPLPVEQLAVVNHFVGTSASDVIRD